jgi:hypothetical protein
MGQRGVFYDIQPKLQHFPAAKFNPSSDDALAESEKMKYFLGDFKIGSRAGDTRSGGQPAGLTPG